MAMVKRLLVWLLAGAFVGHVVTSFFGPRFLGWYNAPGAGGALCKCEEVTRATADSIIHAQLIGALLGAVIALILGIIVERWRSSRVAKTRTTAPSDTAPSARS